MAIQVEENDKEFTDSPDTGRPTCICSRCGSKIKEHEFALRIFTGKKRNTEYRYCEGCQTKDMGITHSPRFETDEDDFWDVEDGFYLGIEPDDE